ncbi:MAG: hypothetical protein HUU54_05750 [Ignavibacteriaceae bacterium]|nr:hypothetical protein [Ignavibacteriaceae bacterium]
MSRTIPLEKDIIFGPVDSRRLGVSIGINLLPTNKKICSYNCLYCFYGYTPKITEVEWSNLLPPKNKIFSSIDRLVEQITLGLIKPDFITFAGNGEPTLHPDFPEIVDYLLSKISILNNKPGTALFTDATTFASNVILNASAKLDQTLVKIDLVDEETYQFLNRPFKYIKIKEIAQRIFALPNLRVQTAVVKINGNIYTDDVLDYYISLIKICDPIQVQLYNIIYPTAKKGLEEVSDGDLQKLKLILEKQIKTKIVIF